MNIFNAFGLVGGILLILVVLCIGPMIFLWALNTLSELGGSTFYINHSIWSYFVSIVFLAVLSERINQ